MSTGTFLPSFQNGLGFTSIHFRWRMLLSLMSSTCQEHNTHGTEAQIILIPPSAPPLPFFPPYPQAQLPHTASDGRGHPGDPLIPPLSLQDWALASGSKTQNISSLRKVPQHQLCAAARASGQASWDQGRGDQPGKWHCRGKVRTAQLCRACLPCGHVWLDQKFYKCSTAVP